MKTEKMTSILPAPSPSPSSRGCRGSWTRVSGWPWLAAVRSAAVPLCFFV
jgi:hypothetical protein